MEVISLTFKFAKYYHSYKILINPTKFFKYNYFKKQGLNKYEILSLIAVFDEAGFDAKNVVSVGDTINEIVNAAGIDSGVAEAIVDALGLEASTSFSDAVAAYNAAFGTSLSVGQAREALGLDDDQDVGNSN